MTSQTAAWHPLRRMRCHRHRRRAEDGGTSRIDLRLPDSLKLRIEEAAGRQRLSVNARLVRAAQAALEPDDRDRGPRQRSPRGGQRYTGWVR
jgi:hypothetical protein